MTTQNGLVQIATEHSVDEAVEKLKGIFAAKGIMLFAVIDHSGEAQKAGLEMPPTKVVVFGSPKAGTPVMLAAPSIAIDLPLKILVAEDSSGKVTVTYNDPSYLKARHSVPDEVAGALAAVEVVAKNAAN